ncbi:hypothetical protein ACXX82_00675 [Glaciimonas sp. GNP009]
MRERGEIKIPAFAAYPIMLVDTHALTPALGYVFNSTWLDPQESIVSMLWKFARMNLIAGHLIAGQISRTVVDPYEGINPSSSEVDIRRVHQMLCLPSKLIRNALLPDGLGCPDFRYCPRCMRRGYHSVVHQIALVTHCPIHGNALQNACVRCDSKTLYRLNAILLDAPFRCGYCQSYYGTCHPRFLERTPLNLKARVAITRMRLHYFAH